MATTLSDLVSEIFGLIFEYLDLSDLSNFSKINKAFHAFVTPFLYHTISFDWTDLTSQRHFQLFIRSILHQPYLAGYVKHFSLQNALHNTPGRFWTPALRSIFAVEDYKYVEDAVEKIAENKWVEEAIEKVMLQSKFGRAQTRVEWLNACNSGNRDALVGLLLCQLSSLQSLSICRDILANSDLVSTILTALIVPRYQNGVPSQKYSDLRSVDFSSEIRRHQGGDEHISDHDEFTHRNQFNTLDTHAFLERRFHNLARIRGGHTELSDLTGDDSAALAFFYLPQIKTLTISFVGSSKVLRWPDIPPCATTLRNLSLKNSEASEETLADILSKTPNLESLRYDYHIDTHPISGPNMAIAQCSGSKIGDAIRQVSGSLQKLDINIHFFNRKRIGIERDFCRIPTSIGALSQMTQLESLKINASLLFGWDNEHIPDLSTILPPNLRDLTMSLSRHIGNHGTGYPWTEEHLLRIFSSFLPQCYKHTPNLRLIVMEGCFRELPKSWTISEDGEYVDQERAVSNLEKLQDMCNSFGIVCGKPHSTRRSRTRQWNGL